MNTPRLRPVQFDDSRRADIGAEPSLPLFEVVRGGVFGGRRYRRGDVLECGEARPVLKDADSAWVLVPKGVGYPVFGRCQVDGLFGSVGEKCNPVRWQPAGEVRQVWRRDEGVWAEAQVLQAAPTGLVAVPGNQRPRVRVPRRQARHQLPLFGALRAA